MIKNLYGLRGKIVEIYAVNPGVSGDYFFERGQVVDVLAGYGDGTIFISLDNGTLINFR